MARKNLLQVWLSQVELAALDRLAEGCRYHNRANNRSEAVRRAIFEQLRQKETATNGNKTKTTV